jgi:protein-disulfide isomerase/uncharacterized membrane protein
METKKHFFSFNFYSAIIIFLCLSGFFVSLYLSFSHYKIYTDIAYKSFCAISKSINCDTVSQSKYAIFLDVPVAVWGMIGYVLFLFLFLTCLDTKNKKIVFFPFLFLISAIFALISLVLGFISSFYISAYCIMCIASWAINFFLLFYLFLIRQRFKLNFFPLNIKKNLSFIFYKKKKFFAGIFIVFVLTANLLFFFPKYWEYKIEFNAQVESGLTKDGHPWIGAKNPEIEIIEYSDYLCFQCKKMHFYLRNFIAQNPGKIRLIHKNFPMDHSLNPLVKTPYHSGSGKMAMLAVYAALKNKFLEMNDFLFKNNKSDFNLKMAEKATGINSRELYYALRNKNIRLMVKKDIYEGLKLNIDATPAYVIEGQVYIGNIPKSVFDKLKK